MLLLLMTEESLNKRIKVAVYDAFKVEEERKRQDRIDHARRQSHSLIKFKAPLEVLSERVEALEFDKKVAETNARMLKKLEEDKAVVKDLKLRCGTPVFYEQCVIGKGVTIITATVQQYIADVNMYIIELCGTGELRKVPLKSLIRIQKDGAK